MTSKDFVIGFLKEKEYFLDLYFDDRIETEVKSKINQLNLDKEKKELLKQIFDAVTTDVMYTILLGLDGCAQIGGVQEDYKIFDRLGNELTGGEIEGHAYEYFHGKNKLIR
jgi:hypothetical protein